jgi:hypothetical protein
VDYMDRCGYDAVLLIMAGQILATSSGSDALAYLLQRTVCGLQMPSSEMTDT